MLALQERDARLHARYGGRVSPDRSALVTPSGRAIGAVPSGWKVSGRLAIPPGGGALTLPSGAPAVAEPVSPTLEAFVVHAFESERITSIPRPLVKLRFLGRDRAELDIGGNVVTLRPRLAEILALLCANPDGMSAERLCADLHGDGGSVSSVRVEVSRLRKLLGPWIDTDRYRLTCDVETDVRRVEGLLASSQVREAAEAYDGALLPSSEAPGVVRERERLDHWLRQAVMTAEDPEALWAYLQTASDDLGAWKRLLTQLEFRDPRRALAAVAGRRAACSAHVTPGWSTPLRGEMQATRAHRGLSTARAALHVTWLLARAPDGRPRRRSGRDARQERLDGVQPARVACATRASRSATPAACTGSANAFRETVAEESDRHDLSGVVDDLLARTHKRAYLAVLRGNQLRVVLERGLQGMPKLPGMNPEIADNAHALALGKVVLALGPRDAVEQYASGGLKRFTAATITDPRALHEELRRIRLTGVAEEREEFERDFCCLAAPVLDHERRFLGAVGISMSRRAFDSERAHLEETLKDVVGFQRSAEIRADLDHGPHAHVTALQGRRFQRRRP